MLKPLVKALKRWLRRPYCYETPLADPLTRLSPGR